MKKKMSVFVSAVTAAALAVTAFAADSAEGNENTGSVQPKVDYSSADGAAYSSILYDSTNGLPTSDANAIAQTANGFVWIGTYSGLIRYDGSEFYSYDSSYGIPNVISLFEDSKDRLWIGTNDNGAACYDNGEFKLYEHVEGLKSSSIRGFTEDPDGTVLVATKMGMAYVTADGSMHPLDDPQLNIEDIRELKNDGNGVIYGHTNTGSFFTIEDKHITSFYSGTALGIGAVSAVCPDTGAKGFAYLGTSRSEIIHANLSDGMKSYTVTDVSPLVNINDISSLDGNLWICADNGIGFIDANGTFELLENIPMNNSIDSMMRDYEGNLWFVSSRQGVMKISPSEFTDINKAAGMDEMVVNSTCINNGDLYIGTDTGLHVLDAETYKEKPTEIGEYLSGSRVRCIKNDSKGNLWFSTYDGLVCKKADGKIVTFNEENGLGTNKVRVSEELSDGRIVISTNSGVYFIKDLAIEGVVSSDSGLSNAEILTICEGDNGKLLLGSNGSGLYIVDGNNVARIGRTPPADGNSGLRSDVILRIKKDPYTGIYWLITSSSIAYMRGSDIYTVTGFPYSNNFDIFFREDGTVWLLSSNGIYVTSEKQLTDNNDIRFKFFDTGCGLPSVATANSHSFMTEDGRIFISGSKGVSVVNTSDARENGSDIRLSVPFIEADGKLLGIKDEEIVIPAETQRITIYGYALTYSLRNPKLSYMLSGFDQDMTTSLRNEMRPVSYTNLPGGTYVYRLSLIDPITGDIQKSASVTIKKNRSLFEQYWFRVLLIVICAVIVFLLFELLLKRREAKLIKERERKQQLIDEMTKAFANCIDMKDKYTNGHSTRVAEYSKLIAERCGKPEEEVKEIYSAALLHDIGKISIPDAVLNKDGRPTDEEYAILKSHTTNGYKVLKDITISPELSYGAYYHHERLDGKGYPQGLTGDKIPDVGQIIAVADTFDAMYSTRPYRKQMDVHDVLAELRRVSGTQLNGEYVECLAELIEDGSIEQKTL